MKKIKILHITDLHLRHNGRLFYSTGKKINNGLIQNGHNFVSSLRIFHSLLPGEIFGSMELARNERGAHLIAKLSRAYLEDGASQAQQSFKLFSSGFLFLFVSIPTFLNHTYYIISFL